MIQILGTTRDEVFSKLIRKATGECISHVAVQVDSMVIHANKHGVHYQSLEMFLKENVVVTAIVPVDFDYEQELCQKIKNNAPKMIGQRYDFPSLFFIGLRLFLRKYLKIPIPKQNLWQVTNMKICTECVDDLLELNECDMLTPYGLLQETVDSKKWKFKGRCATIE